MAPLLCKLSGQCDYCAKILSVFYDDLDASDPNDPNVIIKIDVS